MNHLLSAESLREDVRWHLVGTKVLYANGASINLIAQPVKPEIKVLDATMMVRISGN